MSNANGDRKSGLATYWPIAVVSLIFVLFLGAFLIEFVDLSGNTGAIAEDQLTGDSYMDRVGELLAEADPSRAPEIIFSNEYACASCHLGDTALAPDFAELPSVAEDRRPPLQPAAYIYESIVYPAAFEVEGAWRANMPINFVERLSDQQLGDVIAWLLLPADERPS